jgi:hypothetical protein
LRTTHIVAASLAIATIVAALSCAAPPAAKRGPALAFIDDDYARALGEAKARNLPIFVDSWAPW